MATTVAPTASPMSTRRSTTLSAKWRSGEAGESKTHTNMHVRNRYTVISPASIMYSGQCERRLWMAVLRGLRAIALAGSIPRAVNMIIHRSRFCPKCL